MMQHRYLIHGTLGETPTTEEGPVLPYTTEVACAANNGQWEMADPGPGGRCVRIAPAETLEPGESPTPTPDQAVPGSGVAPPNDNANEAVSDGTVFGIPTKYLLIGSAGLAVLLLLKK